MEQPGRLPSAGQQQQAQQQAQQQQQQQQQSMLQEGQQQSSMEGAPPGLGNTGTVVHQAAVAAAVAAAAATGQQPQQGLESIAEGEAPPRNITSPIPPPIPKGATPPGPSGMLSPPLPVTATTPGVVPQTAGMLRGSLQSYNGGVAGYGLGVGGSSAATAAAATGQPPSSSVAAAALPGLPGLVPSPASAVGGAAAASQTAAMNQVQGAAAGAAAAGAAAVGATTATPAGAKPAAPAPTPAPAPAPAPAPTPAVPAPAATPAPAPTPEPAPTPATVAPAPDVPGPAAAAAAAGQEPAVTKSEKGLAGKKRERGLTVEGASKRAREMQLRDFMVAVGEYGSTVPGEATRYHLQKGGMVASNSQIVTLMSLAADHLVANIVHESSLYRHLRLQRPGEQAREDAELGGEDGQMLTDEDLSMSLVKRGILIADSGVLTRRAGPAAVAAEAAAAAEAEEG
ncbi:unnamed protein product [Pylaiella littoralis]